MLIFVIVPIIIFLASVTIGAILYQILENREKIEEVKYLFTEDLVEAEYPKHDEAQFVSRFYTDSHELR